MSLLVLDEHLSPDLVMAPLAKHYSAKRLQDFLFDERLLDDRVPVVLLALNRPTFLTIDAHFEERGLCHPKYCILRFAVQDKEQYLILALFVNCFACRSSPREPLEWVK